MDCHPFMKRKLEEGWSFFKLKIGIKHRLEEARAAIEIRRHLGAGVALHRSGAIQGGNIKTIKMGGIAPTVHAMSVCGALGLNINLAGKVAESSIAAAAIVQLGCLAPNLDWGLNITNHYLAEDVTDAPLLIEHGTVRRPRGPGLGVAVSEAKVKRLRLT